MLQQVISILMLASLAMAGEAVHTTSNAWKYGTGGGIIGFAILILDIITILEVIKSNRLTSHKLLWSLLIFIFPIGGLIIYYLFSNRASHSSSSGYEPV